MIVNAVASHAFHSLQQSNRVVDAKNLFPNVVDTVKISIRLLPIIFIEGKNKIEMIFYGVR